MVKIKLLFSFLLLINTTLFAQLKKDNTMSLSIKERSIVSISAYTAQGNMLKLQTALNDGLNAGLTVSEVKEMLVQLYAYTGFPRSLNALTNFMNVLNERKKNGAKDAAGKEPSAYHGDKNMLQRGTENQTNLTGVKIGGGVYEFAPAIDQFLKEHLFGAIFSRDILDWKTREIVTISALAAMEGVEPQLRSHYNVGIHNGLTTPQLSQLVTIIETINRQRGFVARQVLQSVIDQKPYNPSPSADELIFPKGEIITNDNFTGNAYLQMLIAADSLNSTAVGNVTFEPGARTKWHLHPGGQILLVIDGVGYYQEKGQPKKILRKGDAVKCPPNVPHWHGASPDTTFVQVAVTNNDKGTTVWLEEVTNAVYHSSN